MRNSLHPAMRAIYVRIVPGSELPSCNIGKT